MARVLIVDDEPYQRLLVKELLSADAALTFIEARDGQLGLELARMQRPDVILLDMMMPGLDGLEACRQLKADPDLRAIPVILVAAVPLQLAGVETVNIPANAFLSKPFQQTDLMAKVARFLKPD